MQATVNKMKICRNCCKSSLQNKDNMLVRICIPQMVNKNGFESCKEFEDRQCTLCTYEKNDPGDDRCELCMKLYGKPYFELRKVSR